MILMMKEVLKKQWEYILYENQNDLILSVVCGNVLMYDIEIKLNNEQKTKYLNEGESFLNTLAEQVRYNPEKFSGQKV